MTFVQQYTQRGLTVVEMIVVTGISLVLMTALVQFISFSHPLSQVTLLQARSTETARIQLKRIASAIRESRLSDSGGYHLVETSPQRLIFYSDVDADATTERVRYELVGTDLVRGITEPSGVPLMYDVANEQVTTVAASVVNGGADVFTYYSGDYPADLTPLTPADLTEVKYIQFRLVVDVDVNQDPPPIDVVSQVQLRNLKTNLGEVVP